MFKSEVTDQFPLDQMWPYKHCEFWGGGQWGGLFPIYYLKKYLNSVN